MRRLRLADVMRERAIPGRAALLYLTDRCPVGCGHCSVDSTSKSPTISDFDLFERLVAGLCDDPDVQLVGISGGEPFVERRGLIMATEALAEAGKDVVVYTSGVWARAGVAQWVRDVLARTSCVYLSTDAFHEAAIDGPQYVRAARAIADAGVPIVAQVLDEPAMVASAQRLLSAAFGPDVEGKAELSLISPLPYGRGSSIFLGPPKAAVGQLPPCQLLGSPTIRYDGVATACCNEEVIVGKGPDRLRRSCASASDVREALGGFRSEPALAVLGTLGPVALTAHPALADLAERRYRSVCELCWAAQDRLGRDLSADDNLLSGLAVLASAGGGQ